MWERGDKTNQGIPELNASSVGMAKVTVLFVLPSVCVYFFLSGSPLQEFEFNMTSTFLSKVSSKYMKSKWHLYPSQVKL